jgi:hypothetical protein
MCKKKVKEQPASPAKPQAQQIGSISLIHPDYGFALIQTRKGFSLPDGTELKSYSPAGASTGKLKSTPARQGSFITADIASGNPKKGDLVMHDPGDSLKPNLPKPTAPASSSSAPPPVPTSHDPNADLPLPEYPKAASSSPPSVSASPTAPVTADTRIAPPIPEAPEQLPDFEPATKPTSKAKLRTVPSIPLTAQ